MEPKRILPTHDNNRNKTVQSEQLILCFTLYDQNADTFKDQIKAKVILYEGSA